MTMHRLIYFIKEAYLLNHAKPGPLGQDSLLY